LLLPPTETLSLCRQQHALSFLREESITMAMSSIEVNDNDIAQLIDVDTEQVLMNCTRTSARSLLLKDDNDRETEGVYVNLPYEEYGDKGLGLTWDCAPEHAKEEVRHAKCFIQFACVIAGKLKNGKDVVVYCKNGRSRSPSVLASFFLIFRGMSLSSIFKWFRKAYKDQRPLTNRVSASFPNFDRFGGVLRLLEKALRTPDDAVKNGLCLSGRQ
jgi:hypothetical protein